MDCDKEYKIELLSADGKYEYYVTLSKKRIEHENKTVEKIIAFQRSCISLMQP